MNKLTLTIFLTSLLAIPVAQAADEEDHSAHHPAADPAQADAAPEDKAAAMGMEKMQDKMKKMQDLMAKIRATTDPGERAKLMKEHMSSMQESMKTMGDMMGKGGMMGKKKPDSDASSAPPVQGEKPGGEMMMGGMMKMHKKMEARMDAMQKMLEQMIEREAMEQKMEGR